MIGAPEDAELVRGLIMATQEMVGYFVALELVEVECLLHRALYY